MGFIVLMWSPMKVELSNYFIFDLMIVPGSCYPITVLSKCISKIILILDDCSEIEIHIAMVCYNGVPSIWNDSAR